MLLAGTDTAPLRASRRLVNTGLSPLTAAADAELPGGAPPPSGPMPCPPAGWGAPAVIAWAVLQGLNLPPLVLDLGAPVAPAIPHLQLNQSPARCLSTGR